MPDPVATVLRVSTQTVGLDATGASQTVTATVLDQNNQAMAATVNWSSANPLVATVDAIGRITAVDNGAAIITAQVSNLTAQVGVTVEQVAAGLELSASSLELDEATPSTVLEAVLVDAQGVAMDDDGIAWASSDTLIAGVEQSGRVTAIRRCEAVITATSGAFEASATVNVLLPYRSMFRGAESFNQNVGDWDVSSGFQFGGMFEGASRFDQDISGWDVSSARAMIQMFKNARSFNQNLRGWCVSRIDNEPFEFDLGASAWRLPESRPQWGRACRVASIPLQCLSFKFTV